MSHKTHYHVEIQSVEILVRMNHSSLLIEIELDKEVRETGCLDSKGKPNRNHILTFSRTENDTGTFFIRLRGASGPVGDVSIGAKTLLEESFKDFRWILQAKRKYFSGEGVGRLSLRLTLIDSQAQAEIELTAAEQNAEYVNALGLRIEDGTEVINTLIAVADGMIAIVDEIAEISPVFSVSWKAVTAVYRLASHQFKKDKQVVEMVKKMQIALRFSREADELESHSETLKPIVKDLLHKIVECSRYIQGYKGGFLGLITEFGDTKKVEEYSKCFSEFRRDLDTAIGLNTNKELHDMRLQQRLRSLLEPVALDPSDMTKRPRCLEGTRSGYVRRIMEFLLDESSPNIYWLTGAAGTGKSTIAVTVSDRCRDKRFSLAYMFFKREKSNPYSVIRTIAHTLASRRPSTLGQHILQALEETMAVRDTVLKDQFRRLLSDPLHAKDDADRVIIILDALDECGSVDDRRALLHLLRNDFAKLPPSVRILVTSRPEPDIENILSAVVKRDTLLLNSKDVNKYINKELEGVLMDPDEDHGKYIREICNAADGHFIWASTAIKMIRLPIDPRRNIQDFKSNIQSLGKHGLDILYATALERSGIWLSRSKDDATAVLGLMLFAKEAMDADTIAGMLGLSKRTIELILGPLRSVISFESGMPVCFYHASFADYLLSPGGKSWHVSETEAKQNITERCFDVMATSLRFNICDIESSFLPNSRVPGLDERIKKNIPPHLSYACRFWSEHMCELEKRGDFKRVFKRLRAFLTDNLLYWLEVLSLEKCITEVGGRALNDANMWIESADREISSYLWFAYKLVGTFWLPISQSVPQIYLSAISLWKGESRIADRYSKAHPTINVCTIGTKVPSRCIRVLGVPGGFVRSVAVSPDGRRIACSSDYLTLRIWDTDSGEALWSNLEMVGTIAFSPVGKYIVSCSRKGTVCTWEVGSGKRVSSFNILGVDFSDWNKMSVAYSSNNKRVVSVCDGRVFVFYVDDGKLEAMPNWFKDVVGVRFRSVSTNGEYVAGTRDDSIAIWDSSTGKQISDPFKTDIDTRDPIAVSPDGKRLVAGSRDGIRVWNVDSGDLVAKPTRIRANCIGFSSDRKRIVVGDHFGEIVILDADTGGIIWGPTKGDTSLVTSVTFTPGDDRVISGTYGAIRIWDVSGGEISSGSCGAHTDRVNSVAFSPDGKRIVSGSDAKGICIWDAGSSKLLDEGSPTAHISSVRSLAFSPNGKRIVSGSADRTVCIWDADNGGCILGPLKGHVGWVRSVAYSTDGKRIVSGSYDKTIRVWDADNGNLVREPLNGHTKRVLSASFSPDGKWVVSGSKDNTIRIWDVATGESRGLLEGHSDCTSSVMFSPNGKHIVSSSWDNTIRIWDVRDVSSGAVVPGRSEKVSAALPSSPKSRVLVPPPSEVCKCIINSVSYSPDGKHIVSGSNDSTICVWDAETGELVLGPLKGHTGCVESVSFSPGGRHVASGSLDGTIRVWNVSIGAGVPGHSERRTADTLAASSSYRRIGAVATSRGEADVPKPIIDWKLHEDGWVKGERGELLVWIPEDRRETLCRARNTAVFGCEFSTKLEFSGSPIGENWANGYPRDTDKLPS